MDDLAHPPIVIGGGVAGISAAVELARAGARPILLESRPYLGGRARSFVHTPTGDEIDNGQHLLMGCYRATFRLLDLIGTRHLTTTQAALTVDFRHVDGTCDRLRSRRPLPAPLDVLAGMMRMGSLSRTERRKLVRVALDARRRKSASSETVAQLLERTGQSARARERLWDPMVIATLNAPPERAAAGLFLEVLRRAFLGSAEDSRLAFARAGLSQLFQPAADFIAHHGGTVRTNATVLAISRKEDDWLVKLRGSEVLRASSVIVALPAPAAARMLVAAGIEELSAWLKAEHSPIVSLYLWFDRPLPEVPEISALLGGRLQWVFNRRRISGQESAPTGLLACTVSAASIEAHETGEQLIALADSELRCVFPELGGTRLVDAIVLKEREATFLATPEMEPLRPEARTRFPGLWLAGDWTRTGLPATIEGAAQSGFHAARLARDGWD